MIVSLNQLEGSASCLRKESPLTSIRHAGWTSILLRSDEFLRILDPGLPVVVISYSGNSYTLSNPFQTQFISALTLLYKKFVDNQLTLVSHQGFWNQKFGSVTPHRAQRASIRNLLVEDTEMSKDPPPFIDTVNSF